ncbi:MAG TPA: LCP family protein [Gaiellales bacterium]|jgi:LCP family protein required for cell wall assembly|nr:LCP family protein [Gaiellales bacterium]
MATQTPPTTPTDGGGGAPPPIPPKPKMTIYGGGKPPNRRRRRWVRVALWTTGSLLLVLVTVAAVVGYWLYGNYSQITSVSPFQEQAEKVLVPKLPVADAPVVALVIGSDHRYTDGSAPARSDTLMLVRIDPKTNLISLLSLPRDLYVNIPGVGMDKINDAYTYGHDKLSVETVKSLTGLPINYEINVDFHGFIALVNDLGGVYLNVDQRYYHSNAGVVPGSIDSYSAINLQPGYQLLHGTDALAFARYRHTDSDFYRNARQQLFLRAFEQKASTRFHGISVTDFSAIRNVIDDVSGNLHIAAAGGTPGLSTLLKYATAAYQARGHIISVKLAAHSTIGPGGASIVEPDSSTSIKTAVHQFLHPQKILQPGGQLPSEKKPAKKKKHGFTPKVPPSSVPVSVLNGTTKTGEAAATASALGDFGYPASSGNADTQSYSQTWVYFQPGFQKAAGDVAKIMGKGQVGPLPSVLSGSSGSVVVVLGTDFSGKLKIKPPHRHTSSAYPPTITPDSQVYLNDFRAAADQKNMRHFYGLYPTVTQANSVLEQLSPGPVRTYTIPYNGHNWASMYAEFQLTTTVGGYWGIEETRFTEAPILQNPQATRNLDGRSYRFFFNGSHIHLIGFIEHGTAYWVTNTLLDELTNQEMIAIARSLKPTR